MGGLGSGLHFYQRARSTTEDLRSIDIRRWQRDGLLKKGQAFRWLWLRRDEVVASIWVEPHQDRVVLNYRQRSPNAPWQDEKYGIQLSWTPCHLGGQRPWLICPALVCGRRVALVYGGAIFTCRKCQDVAYPSQSESPGDRAARRANRIRRKLGWEPGILNGNGCKPDGMHWKTYWRLREDHDRLVKSTLQEIKQKLGIRDLK